MSRPKLSSEELRWVRLELKVKEIDMDWLTQEAKKRRIPRATLAYQLIMQEHDRITTIADTDTS